LERLVLIPLAARVLLVMRIPELMKEKNILKKYEILNSSPRNISKWKLIYMIFKHPVRTSQKTQLHHYKGQHELMFWELIVVYSEKKVKLINTLCGRNTEPLTVILGFTCRWVLNG
jgi:hypothetical protein